MELVCKIWFESIQPFTLCLCVKNGVLVCIFITKISVSLSWIHATFLRVILTLDSSNDVSLQRLVHFGVSLINFGGQSRQKRQNVGVNWHFQAQLAKY